MAPDNRNPWFARKPLMTRLINFSGSFMTKRAREEAILLTGSEKGMKTEMIIAHYLLRPFFISILEIVVRP